MVSEPEPGFGSDIALDDRAIVGIGDLNGARQRKYGGSLVHSVEAGERSGASFVRVRKVEVLQPCPLDDEGRLLGVVQGEFAVAEHRMASREQPGRTRRVGRCAPGCPSPVIGSRIRSSKELIDIIGSVGPAAVKIPNGVVR